MANGIVKYKDYTFWTHAKTPIVNGLSITDCVTNDLKKRFQNCRIYREFDNIDLYMIDEFLPVEIQSTVITNGSPSLASFEDACTDQIDENIYNLGMCWLFMDSELLRYLQVYISRKSSMQLDWLYEYMKDNKLKVFTIDYRGNVLEKSIECFDFIYRTSVTNDDNENNTLDKIKYDILQKVFEYYDITQEQLDTDQKNVRNIFQSLGHIDTINNTFTGNIVGNNHTFGTYIGIFESEGKKHHNRIRFLDSPNIAQYFPEYVKKKDRWDQVKGKWIYTRRMEEIIKGNIDYNSWEKI